MRYNFYLSCPIITTPTVRDSFRAFPDKDFRDFVSKKKKKKGVFLFLSELWQEKKRVIVRFAVVVSA